MQYWITVLNLSGWKAHFITPQFEFLNFLSLSSGKPECFAILALALDINLKKPSFLEGCLGFALVSTCFRHSHLSPGWFSCMQSSAEVNPISLFHGLLMSPQRWFLYQHFSLSLSASPLQHHLYQLPTLSGKSSRVAKFCLLWLTAQGAGTHLQWKKAVPKLGTSLQTLSSLPSLSGSRCQSPQGKGKSCSWFL